jgi:hypothetical protein
MSGRIVAVLDRIEAEQQSPSLPKHIRALELLQMIYRGEVRASPQQMRAAIESLPYENPNMSAVAVSYLDGNTFAEKLDRAIARSDRAKLIEGRAERVEGR